MSRVRHSDPDPYTSADPYPDHDDGDDDQEDDTE
jgi:hypothetical protein